jgi:hypothetical protein
MILILLGAFLGLDDLSLARYFSPAGGESPLEHLKILKYIYLLFSASAGGGLGG